MSESYSGDPRGRDPQYLGDGVYASHDGFQIWLAEGNHRNIILALEPAVFVALVQYAHRIWKKPEETPTE